MQEHLFWATHFAWIFFSEFSLVWIFFVLRLPPITFLMVHTLITLNIKQNVRLSRVPRVFNIAQAWVLFKWTLCVRECFALPRQCTLYVLISHWMGVHNKALWCLRASCLARMGVLIKVKSLRMFIGKCEIFPKEVPAPHSVCTVKLIFTPERNLLWKIVIFWLPILKGTSYQTHLYIFLNLTFI